MKLGTAKRGSNSKFRYLQFNNFALSTLFQASLHAIRPRAIHGSHPYRRFADTALAKSSRETSKSFTGRLAFFRLIALPPPGTSTCPAPFPSRRSVGRGCGRRLAGRAGSGCARPRRAGSWVLIVVRSACRSSTVSHRWRFVRSNRCRKS